ncbi:DUF6233 domain-containing protein [Streptomyces sp. NBC_01335]|uniref:DUF6233 domain-containing protein n=1 Tax=Streptomyces sp. NBC_01335 TaxID=2903828 RepID=UPI003FA36835
MNQGLLRPSALRCDRRPPHLRGGAPPSPGRKTPGAWSRADHPDLAVLHRGGCTLSRRGGLIPREQAVLALSEDYIRCCEICTPETGIRAGR